jgi:NAD(P)-dependent dehydrogenase (short-subunit alcohol dehydrogenase family)
MSKKLENRVAVITGANSGMALNYSLRKAHAWLGIYIKNPLTEDGNDMEPVSNTD